MPPERYTPVGADAVAADLTERFRDRLRLFAARRLGDAAAAEDVAQEALRRTLEALRAGRIEKAEALPGFLFQTARHICQHHGRSAGRAARAFSRLGPAASGEADPLTALVAEERRGAVRRALERLGEDDRELLRLFYVEGLTAAEVALRLGLTPETVRVRKHRALRRLREALGNVSEGQGT